LVIGSLGECDGPVNQIELLQERVSEFKCGHIQVNIQVKLVISFGAYVEIVELKLLQGLVEGGFDMFGAVGAVYVSDCKKQFFKIEKTLAQESRRLSQKLNILVP
jgi:hypothetical protein